MKKIKIFISHEEKSYEAALLIKKDSIYPCEIIYIEDFVKNSAYNTISEDDIIHFSCNSALVYKVLEEIRSVNCFVFNKKFLMKKYNKKVLNSFVRKQEQIPPIYSAIKVNGKKLYEYARSGEKVEVQARQIEIYNIELEKVDVKNEEIVFKVECSKGTYIRSLCEDIATRLGTIGYMKELNRTRVGSFKIEDSITLEELEKCENVNLKVITMEELLKQKEKIILNKKQLELFLNGVKLDNDNQDGLYRIYNQDKQFIGIGVLQGNKLKRDIIK